MGIALSALSAFQQALSPLHQWLDSMLGASGHTAPVAHTVRATCPPSAAPPRVTPSVRAVACSAPRQRQALRVVRLVDPSSGFADRAGARVVISGRLADVCAELDRLAAAEAAVSLRH
jgi:hypothetical protein